jgi:cyanate permease
MSWSERKLHWFNKKQNKRALIITSMVLMLVGAFGMILTSAIRFALIKS